MPFSLQAVGQVLPSPSTLVSLLSLAPSSLSCLSSSSLSSLFPVSLCPRSAVPRAQSDRLVSWRGGCLCSRWRWQLLRGPFPSPRALHCPAGAPPPAPASPLIRTQRREVLLKVVLGPHEGMVLPTLATCQTPKTPEVKGQQGSWDITIPGPKSDGHEL